MDGRDLDHFYLEKDEPLKSCLLALREIILDSDPEVYETRKYGMPCFCLGKRHFTYLWTDKKSGQPYVLFVDGALLDHPELKQGDRKRMRIFPIDSEKDIPIERLRTILKDALTLCRKA